MDAWMPRSLRPLLVLTLACVRGSSAGTASFLQTGQKKSGSCVSIPAETGVDDIAYSMMTERICKINWVLSNKATMRWVDVKSVGCWKLLAFNTDNYMSSGVYQNQNDNRCTLVFSGYHGKLVGGMKAISDTVQIPPKKVQMCGNNMYEPFVKLMRRHFSLANWSNVAEALGGRGTTCSDISVTAESMGGSAAEILAGCANMGQLETLQNKSLPSFKISSLFTFGGIGPSTEPIKNPSRSDGCFPGMRFFISGDMYAGLGKTIGLHHSRMDATEIFHTSSGVSRRIYSCQSDDAVNDSKHKAPPASEALAMLTGNADATNHEITTYKKDLELFHNISWEDKGRPESENPNRVQQPRRVLGLFGKR